MSTKRALVCAPAMPEFDRASGSQRIFNLIEFLREAGWAVSFVARDAPAGQRYVRVLQQRGVATYVGFNSRLEELIGAGRFHVAVLAFWHTAALLLPLIRRLSPGTRILVDSIDLHFLRNSRGILHRLGEGGPGRLLDQRFASEMVRELNLYAAADGVLTVSQKEADLINDFTGDPSLASTVPDAEDLPPSPLGFAERKGILFVGNFRHAPNVSAVEYLCRQIVPLVKPPLLAEHPITVVGNDLNETVRGCGQGLADVNMVGWVPSLLPYFHRARITVIPLLYGAGTKRKLIQPLMVGTPTVSTTIGVEGLQLREGEHVLVADDPIRFADAIRRLLADADLWSRLAEGGRTHIASLHGRATAAARLLQAVSDVLERQAKPALDLPDVAAQVSPGAYQQLVQKVRELAQTALPDNANVLVVSKGDDRLLELDGRRAGHFPQTNAGVYAGCYPADSGEAVAHLEALRAMGNDFLLFPSTSFWWLDHYVDFREHLDAHYERVRADQSFILYRLAEKTPMKGSTTEKTTCSFTDLERLRPPAADLNGLAMRGDPQDGKGILVLGIYLADQPNTADDVVANFSAATRHRVDQRWVALGGQPKSHKLAAVTVRTVLQKEPKFQILAKLIAKEDLSLYDYVVVTDDDIVLPRNFLDLFISLQAKLGFTIAQPARTSNSYIDLPIVEQQRGVLARETLFVEVGPVFSIHQTAFDLVFPFDLTSSMGWGYENVWAYRVRQRGLKMGIIDAVPVDHSLRKPVTNYAWAEADRQRKAFLQKHAHLPLDQCFRVLEVINFPGTDTGVRHEFAPN